MIYERDPRKYYVYHYEYIDDLSFMPDARTYLSADTDKEAAAWLEAISERLKRSGWEGDGCIKVMWLPPFADVGVGDTYGTYVYAVKQSNNGMTWLASPVPLTYKRLLEQQ